MTSHRTLFIVILIIFLSLGGWLLLQNSSSLKQAVPSQSPSLPQESQTETPRIVGTKPAPLDEGIIAAGDLVEITFNRPLENVGEFKSRMDPEIKYKVELSGDRRTARIIPEKPYSLGTTYTLFIGPETKFDGVGRWGKEKVFHFRTISYRGV